MADKKKGNPDKFLDQGGEGTIIRDENGNEVTVAKTKKASAAIKVDKILHNIGIQANYAIADLEDRIVAVGKAHGFNVSRAAVHLREDYADLELRVRWESTAANVPSSEDEVDLQLFLAFGVRFDIVKSFPKTNLYQVNATLRWPL